MQKPRQDGPYHREYDSPQEPPRQIGHIRMPALHDELLEQELSSIDTPQDRPSTFRAFLT